ncbi:MAG: aminofutalosine synthase MqnE [Deltaproteobacteria bacterium]|nr:aminofutalosine synthase MqnE [Deltaproteobacteria bacterium]MCL5276671.1 aminofutalosine synthase MqnE [Deltaproteobacteria bacterium]
MAEESLHVPVSDRSLAGTAEKVISGTRLDNEDARRILGSSDIHLIGAMAEYKKQRLSGRLVYFTLNKQINYTNVCSVHCKVCAYAKGRRAQDAYTMSVEAIVGELSKYSDGLDEVHIVGGLHPDLPFDYYTSMLSSIRSHFPGVTIKAFTATEIGYFARLYGMDVEDVLKRLVDAGLETMPGGGAEILSDRIRHELFRGKESKDRWLSTHRTAHALGIKTNATMLYGHIETDDDVISHLEQLRSLQDETSGFLTFVPLIFHPENTPLHGRVTTPTGIRKLKVVALSRLYLDNFPHIKAYWVMMSEAVTQIALHFGADDVDGTIGGEKVTHAAGAKTPAGLTKERMISMIRDTGYVPARRDGKYKVVKIYE